MPKEPVTNTDILMSIRPEHLNDIRAGVKNHEFRSYLLQASVERIWLYTTAPLQELRYIIRISHGKRPGEVPEEGGLGGLV